MGLDVQVRTKVGTVDRCARFMIRNRRSVQIARLNRFEKLPLVVFVTGCVQMYMFRVQHLKTSLINSRELTSAFVKCELAPTGWFARVKYGKML